MSLSVCRQFTAAVICSLIVLSAGSGYVWPAALIEKLQDSNSTLKIEMTSNELALMVSMMEIANVITPIPSAYLTDMIGRKLTLLISAPLYCAAGLITWLTRNSHCLYVMRFLTGLANGVVFTVVPIYLGEVSEPKYRGACSILFTTSLFLGMLITYFSGKMVSYDELAWIIIAIPVIFIILFAFMPETPHYYLLNSMEPKANKSLMWLRGAKDPEKIEQELEDIHDEIRVIPAIPFRSTEQIRTIAKNPWRELFMTKLGRRSLALGTLVASTQVMGGFFSVFTYAVETVNYFREADSILDGEYVSMVITITTLLVAVLAIALVDVMGRRPMLLTSGIIAFFSASSAAAFYFIAEKTTLKIRGYDWFSYIALICLVAGLNFALGSLLPTLQSELFSTQTRGLASSILAVFQASTCSLMLFIYLPVQKSIGVYFNYVLFAMSISVGTCIIYLFFPETKGKTFAEIQGMLT